jgi:hypothetical protein
MEVTIPDLTGEQCAWAIERFAKWVALSPGVWTASIREARYGARSVELHLVVHASLSDSVCEQSRYRKESP